MTRLDWKTELGPRLPSLFEKSQLKLLGTVPLKVDTRNFARFSHWLEEGRHGQMQFLERYQEIRKDPSMLLEGARSAWIFGLPYHQGDTLAEGESPRVAQYARFRDYHKLMKDLASEVIEEVKELLPEVRGAFRVVVDSAPLLERALAASTARGFIGKNTCFIHRDWGSFLLLGEVITTLEDLGDSVEPLDPTTKSGEGGCGSCTLCQDHCPTGALNNDYSIDARKCLAYWTIEHRGTIPEEFWPHLKTYYFGCDICQLICPYSRSSTEKLPSRITTREFPPLEKIAVMNQLEYEQYFGGTPMTRAKRNGLRRNALIALAVSESPMLKDVLRDASKDPEYPVGDTILQIRGYLSRSGDRDRVNSIS